MQCSKYYTVNQEIFESTGVNTMVDCSMWMLALYLVHNYLCVPFYVDVTLYGLALLITLSALSCDVSLMGLGHNYLLCLSH